ncbi:MAG: hypothetical protein MRJ96_16970 [Nitrospirales bacterium]|nr:hypothetical protein [Nitrospira sp.]MDR4503138.1 hypothetical protein [Nitrospirales bacterium]
MNGGNARQIIQASLIQGSVAAISTYISLHSQVSAGEGQQIALEQKNFDAMNVAKGGNFSPEDEETLVAAVVVGFGTEEAAANAAEAAQLYTPGGSVVGSTIKGYTKHGINQALGRDGVGVSPKAILDTVRSPNKIKVMPDGVRRIYGSQAGSKDSPRWECHYSNT